MADDFLSGKQSKKAYLSRVWAFVKKDKLLLILSAIFSVLSVVANLLVAVFIGKGVDNVIGFGNVDYGELTKNVIFIAGFVVIIVFSEWLSDFFIQKLAYKTAESLRNQAEEGLLNAPLSFIDAKSKGDLLSRMITDANEVSEGLLLGFTQLLKGVATILATLIIMLVIEWQIGLLVVILTPLSLFVARYISKISAEQFKRQAENRGKMTSFVNETVGNQKIVKAFSREERNQEIFDGINADLKESGTKATFFSALTNPSTRFVNNVIYIAVGIFGAMKVISSPLLFTVGDLTAFLIYAVKYTKPFNEISEVITELQSAIVSAKRVFEIIDCKREEDDKGAAALTEVSGSVEFSGVDFSYDKKVELIKNLSFKAKKGQKIAIVGPTGSGKTTLINLLMRFYDVDGGGIFIDKKDTGLLTRKSVRSCFGMVLQESFIKKGTVFENVAYGNKNAKKEDVIKACIAAKADGFIIRLPKGYDTVIDDDDGLSEGEKQLISIARIMVKLPEMLILDEATSSIDTRTEIKIQQAFDTIMKGRTSFVVAHRLSTIKSADLILVLDKGKIVEQGKHEELLSKKGFYYELYNSQFAKVTEKQEKTGG